MCKTKRHFFSASQRQFLTFRTSGKKIGLRSKRNWQARTETKTPINLKSIFQKCAQKTRKTQKLNFLSKNVWWFTQSFGNEAYFFYLTAQNRVCQRWNINIDKTVERFLIPDLEMSKSMSTWGDEVRCLAKLPCKKTKFDSYNDEKNWLDFDGAGVTPRNLDPQTHMKK